MTKTGSRKYRELEYNYNKDIELIISHKKTQTQIASLVNTTKYLTRS